MTTTLDLYWIPLGAGARVVQVSGHLYESLRARREHRSRQDLFHSALVATTADGETVVEMTPVPDRLGPDERGVVGEGPVGSRHLGRLRVFRYEIRRWPGGVIPDLEYAVGGPVPISDDPGRIAEVLDLVAVVPTPVWGRDELDTGEMWNSNSVVSWVLTRAELTARAGRPPGGGRAPGWDAGVAVARRASGRPPRLGAA